MNPKFRDPSQGGPQFDPNQQFGPGGPGDAGVRFAHHAMGAGFFIERIVVAVMLLLVLALLLYLLYRLLRKGPGGIGHSPAIRELEMRYARGEIGRDEYLQRRADLVAPLLPASAGTPTPPAGGTPPEPPKPTSRGAEASS